MSSFVAWFSKLKGVYKGSSEILDEVHAVPVYWSIRGRQKVVYDWCCFHVTDQDLKLAARKKRACSLELFPIPSPRTRTILC